MRSIVLDFDETLAHTFDEKEDINTLLTIRKDPKHINLRQRIYYMHETDPFGSSFELAGIVRPYFSEFISFCFNNFDNVIIWSAGQRRYVESAVSKIFVDFPEPHHIWSFPTIEKHKSGKFYYKPLSKMVDQLHLDPAYTYVVDNQDETFCENKSNAIYIPSYEPKASLKGLLAKDDALLKLTEWLEANMDDEDVRKKDKSKIFI